MGAHRLWACSFVFEEGMEGVEDWWWWVGGLIGFGFYLFVL